MEEALATRPTFARSRYTVGRLGRQAKLYLRRLKLSQALKLETQSVHFPPTAISGLHGRSQEVDAIEANVPGCVPGTEDDLNTWKGERRRMAYVWM